MVIVVFISIVYPCGFLKFAPSPLLFYQYLIFNKIFLSQYHNNSTSYYFLHKFSFNLFNIIHKSLDLFEFCEIYFIILLFVLFI